VRPGSPSMDHALGDSLVIEVGDLLPEVKVFEERGSALANLELVLVVVDGHTLVRGERCARRRRCLGGQPGPFRQLRPTGTPSWRGGALLAGPGGHGFLLSGRMRD
jgi:hypothetical protein